MDDPNAPATKGDIEELRSGMEQLRSEMNHQYRNLVERMDDNFTRLMKAFYDSAETNSKRISLLETGEGVSRARLGALEDRMMAMEKRLNMPPTQ